jgi:hypothetical protein
VSFDALKSATFMALSYYPHSKDAKGLCLTLTEEILNSEDRRRQRKTEDLASFKKAVGLAIGDLLVRANKTEDGWLYRSLSKKNSIDSLIKGDTFLHVIKGLERLGYIFVLKGGNHSKPFSKAGSFGPGLATRYRATSSLTEKAQGFLKQSESIGKHFKRLPSLSVVQLKSASVRNGRDKEAGKIIRLKPSEKVSQLKADLKAINTFLYDQNFEGMEFYGLKQIFNEGDRPDFAWNMGGRLYAIGKDNYQNFKQEERLDIKINGQSVVEIDINASHLRILHSLLSYQLPAGDDIFTIKEIHREVVKSWVKSTLGHTGFHTSWSSKAIESIQKAGIKRPKSLTYNSIQSQILQHFPVLSDWPNCGIRWSRLMYEESEGIIEVMRHLNNHNVPALPVHDSLIVPSSARELTETTFRTVFEHRFGVEFKFDVSSKV